MGLPTTIRPWRRVAAIVAAAALLVAGGACGDDTSAPFSAPGGAPAGVPGDLDVPGVVIDEFVRGLMADTGVSEEQARCLAEIVFSAGLLGEPTAAGPDVELLAGAAERCGIDPGALDRGDPGPPGDPQTAPADEAYVPARPLPAAIPVYPGATMWSDFAAGGTEHHYLFNSPATAEELVAFYSGAFTDLGLDVVEEIVMFEEFFVFAELDGRQAVSLYWLDDPADSVGRGFALAVAFDVMG